MRPMRCASLLAASSVCALPAVPAHAHVVVGSRVFPVTLTFDDPGVADEVSLPAFTYTRSGADGGTGPDHMFDFGFEYDKTITSNTALIFNNGYNIQYTSGSKTEAGWDNIFITGKWQAYTNAAHEFVVSLGVIRELGGTSTLHTGGDKYGSTAPTLYFGKGLGDLPFDVVRPFAVSGEVSYTIADRGLKAFAQAAAPAAASPTSPAVDTGSAAQFNSGSNNGVAGSFSVQYSLAYLQSQVRDYGLPPLIGDLVPIVEVNWTSPTSSPSREGTTWIVAPGVIYLAQWGELGLEALIPGNKASGTTVGAVALVHVFLDDLLPNSLGKPLIP